MKWIGCFGALIAAVGLIIAAVSFANLGRPILAIMASCLAMVALVGATWQYNKARFS